MLTRRRAAACIVLAVTLVEPLTAFAQDAPAGEPDAFTRNAARALAQEGDALFDEGDFASALDRFDRAIALIPAPTLALRRARSLSRLGRLVDARNQYTEVATAVVSDGDPKAYQEAIVDARRELEALEPRIPTLVISRETGVGAVKLDDRALDDALIGVDVPVDPGRHRLSAAGAAPVEVDVEEGAKLEIALRHNGSEPVEEQGDTSGPPVARIAAYSSFALGAVGLGIGIGFGISAIRTKQDLDVNCGASGQCPAAFQDQIDDYDNAGTLSTIGFVVAGLGAAGGITLLVLAPEPAADQTSAQLTTTPAGGPALVMTGSF